MTPERDRDVELAEALTALASPTRLALLRALRSPSIVAEIRVRSPESGSAAPIARQTVSKHLETLFAAGLVHRREVRGERGDTHEFSLNHQSVYALAEEMRDLARLRPFVEPEEPTMHHRGDARRAPASGPALIVVRGLEDGVTFDLTPRPPDKTEWTIGRRRGLSISLDFDPFVSSENTLIRHEGGKHHVVALPTSRNGTLLNFRKLAPEEPEALRHGDIVSVGRTALVYWGA